MRAVIGGNSGTPESPVFRPTEEQVAASLHVINAHAATLREQEAARRKERRARQKRLTASERSLAAFFLVVAVLLGVITHLSLGVVGDDVLDTVRGLEPASVPHSWWMMDAYYLGARWCVLFAIGFVVALLGWSYYILKRYFTAHGFYAAERISMPIAVGAVFGMLGIAAGMCIVGAYAFFIENVHLLAIDADLKKQTGRAFYPVAWHGTHEDGSSMWIAWQFFITFGIASFVAISYVTSRLVLSVGAGATYGIKEYFAQFSKSLFDVGEKHRAARSSRPSFYDQWHELERALSETEPPGEM